MSIPAVTSRYGGRIGWTVGKPNEAPRISGGTLGSATGGVEDDKSKNMIVDYGLNELARGADLGADLGTATRYCYVGTGTAETTPNMTSLQAVYASGNGGNNFADFSASVNQSSASAPWWHERTRTYQFPANGVDGAALTEVGFFRDTTLMGSRVLFRDNLGNPTTVTVLAGERLTINYTIRVDVPTGDTTGTININGTDIGYTLRPANAGDSDFWSPNATSLSSDSLHANTILGSEEGVPTGSPIATSFTSTLSPYVEGSFERKLSITADTSQANGSWDGMRIKGRQWQIKFDQPFTKTSNDVLSFSEFFTFRYARA